MMLKRPLYVLMMVELYHKKLIKILNNKSKILKNKKYQINIKHINIRIKLKVKKLILCLNN